MVFELSKVYLDLLFFLNYYSILHSQKLLQISSSITTCSQIQARIAAVRVKDNRLYLFYFIFSFLFSFLFIFLFLDLGWVSRSLMVDFILFSLLLSFSFSFSFIFYFLFLEQLGLGFISHAVTSVTDWWCSHKTDHGTQENGVEGSGIKWHYITWTIHVGLMTYTWSFRVGCTVVSTDHE